MIHVECITVGAIAENCYIIENAENNECLIVDPGDEAQRIIRCVGERKPQAVLLTHAHFDHIGAVDAVCSHYHIPVYVHAEDASKLQDAAGNVSALFGMPMTIEQQPTILPDRLTLAGMDIEVLHTPGHSAGSVCYILPEGQGIVTGDTLFADGYGRTDFADGSFFQLRHSLRTLFQLTPKMVTYPGHGEPGTAGRDAAEDE